MLPHSEIILRLITAALLGGLIGFERERLNWAAGLRTHMLVCVGSALVIIVSAYGFNDVIHQEHVALDPSRVAAQVVSGIGFLGAGTILIWQDKTIRGLTTAASLWTVAAVGLAAGGGLYFGAFVATCLVLMILIGLKPIELLYLKKVLPREIVIFADSKAISLTSIEQALHAVQQDIKQVRIFQSDKENVNEVQLLLSDSSQPAVLRAIEELRKLPGIQKIES
jgi:putative Mg2+ transporter-C (MgtC) family protein